METVISKDGVVIAVRRAGAGPPLVLVHGTGSSSARWAPVLPALGAHFSVYAMDRRGRGASGDGAAYEIEREFEDVAEVVNSIGDSVFLLGHSYGAICSLEAALLTPRIRRLVLYEPPMPAGVPIYSAGMIERLESLHAAGDHETVLRTFLQQIVRMPPHEFEMIQKSSTWAEKVAAARTLPRELRAHERYQFRPDRFKNLTVPTLLLLGGDSPQLFKAAIDALSVALPSSRVVTLMGQQHVAMETAPELFVREVAGFLNE